jgi:alkylation response protein AidB-like acyl-CoA dehydrogenase
MNGVSPNPILAFKMTMSNQPTEVPSWTEPDPDSARILGLVEKLAAADGPADAAGTWPETLWQLVQEGRATHWSLPREFGGEACPRPLLVQRYAQLASGSLTAVFILSQHDAAVRRLDGAADRPAARKWLQAIAAGKAFATVGISQLTTSRRLGSEALVARESEPGTFQLDGAMPWVTAAERAEVFVTGTLLDDGRQMLIALPVDRPGLTIRPAFELAALQASCTTEVILTRVRVRQDDLLAGPSSDLSAQPGAVGAAGLETSALALGQARAALDALAGLAADRIDLADPVDVLAETWQQAWTLLMSCARGEQDAATASQVRAQANALALRATQAYLTARRGSGFLRAEPAQRWARQALFFLVWSCPSSIAQAAIRDLAGLCPA